MEDPFLDLCDQVKQVLLKKVTFSESYSTRLQEGNNKKTQPGVQLQRRRITFTVHSREYLDNYI